jgi:sugar lactone lactonase YvrE
MNLCNMSRDGVFNARSLKAIGRIAVSFKLLGVCFILNISVGCNTSATKDEHAVEGDRSENAGIGPSGGANSTGAGGLRIGRNGAGGTTVSLGGTEARTAVIGVGGTNAAANAAEGGAGDTDINAEADVDGGADGGAVGAQSADASASDAGSDAASADARAASSSCDMVTPRVPIVQDGGALESLVFDSDGRLLFSDWTGGSVNVIAHKGDAPVVLVGDIDWPCGLALGDKRDVYVGSGCDMLAAFSPNQGNANLIHIDLDTGAAQTYVIGLSMANGVVRASDGTFYASDDMASSLDRVLPDKTVQNTWLPQQSNGMVLSADERTLYVNQSLPAKVMAVDPATGRISVYADTPEGKDFALLDGLTIDTTGVLYAAAYLAGEIWRITRDGSICVIASGFDLPSAVAFGRPGRGFSATSLYVTTHSGSLFELPGVL